MSTNSHYRPDIDGLRALAVIPVILYHADVAGFSGGYIGVDVFFVISGYLITSIIAKEIEEGTFSFMNFWERRARRILPAVTTVLIASLIAGWFILLPWDYRHLGQEVVAQSGFASNIFFWLKSDYFAPEAEFRTLLHTWSLSVEEQFYLLYPALLLLITLRAPRNRIALLAGLAVISLGAALYWMQGQQTTAFYFLPARAWELLIGVLLALTAIKAPGNRLVREAVAWAGVVLIISPVILYDDQTPFPGLAALAPCLGTALLVYTNSARNSVAQFLSLKPVVLIGLLSYSLYLWHWPIIVFVKYLNPGRLTLQNIAIVVVLTGALSTLCYRFIETPIRRRRLLQSRAALVIALAIPIGSAAAFGYLDHSTAGFPLRWPQDIRRLASGLNDTNPKRSRCVGPSPQQILNNDLCHLGSSDATPGRPFLLVWGDSHADALLPAIDAMVDRRGIQGWQIVKDACPPLLSNSVRMTRSCRAVNSAVLTWIEREKPDMVFIIGRWDQVRDLPSDLAEDDPPGLLLALQETLDQIKLPRERVVVFRQAPLQQGDVPRMLVSALRKGENVHGIGKRLDQHRQERLVESRIFSSLEAAGVKTIDPAAVLCDSGLCRASVGAYSAYYDDNHLTVRGAMQLLPLIERQAFDSTKDVWPAVHGKPVRPEPGNGGRTEGAAN